MADRLTNEDRLKAVRLGRGATGGWTKYGGPRQGFLKVQYEEWYCQICGKEQRVSLPAFMYGLGDGDYIKICSSCQSFAKDSADIVSLKRAVANHQ